MNAEIPDPPGDERRVDVVDSRMIVGDEGGVVVFLSGPGLFVTAQGDGENANQNDGAS